MGARGRTAVCLLLASLPARAASAAAADGARSVAVYQNRMGAQYQLREMRYALDGAEVAHFRAGDERLSRPEIPIFDRRLAPGVHTLSVAIDLQGQRIAVFEYLSRF